MIEYFNNNLHAFWFTAGFVLLATELVVLGFSTGFVLFLGLGALLTGGLLWADAIPQTWMVSIASFGVSSGVVSAALWKPFKSLQNRSKPLEKDNSSDLIGYTFRLSEDIFTGQPGRTQYSGITWNVELDYHDETKSLSAGTLVKVVAVDAGKFTVSPAE